MASARIRGNDANAALPAYTLSMTSVSRTRAKVICCSEGSQHQGKAEYAGAETNDLHSVPMQINQNSTVGFAHWSAHARNRD